MATLGDSLLLEQIETDIIRRHSFAVEMRSVGNGLILECDLRGRAKYIVRVTRREGRWSMTDDCSTVRSVGWLWQAMPVEVLDICEVSGVQEARGELWLHVDPEAVYMSLCSLLCAMQELRNLHNQNRHNKPNTKGKK